MQSIAIGSAKLLRPTLGRDLPMTGRCLQRPEKLQLARLSPHTAASKRRAADATPGGRPQYAAPRDEIAPPLAAAEKLLCPTVIDRAPWEILPFQLFVETEYFPFKAGRAGFISVARGDFTRLCFRTTSEIPFKAGGRPKQYSTALKPRGLRLRRGGAPFGCSTGLPVATCIVRALADIGETT